MKKLYILTLFICLAGFGTSFAQTLKGHIYDANTNEPLVGAAVTYKLHGNQGTVSDINGAYEIKLPEGGVDLVFSYIGYEDVLMPIVIGKREVITKDVYMKESTKLLEEVVVSAGRFEQKLSNVTVSMDLVKAGDIVKVKVMEVDLPRKRIALTMRLDEQPGETNARRSAGNDRSQGNNRPAAKAAKPRGRDAQPAGNSAMMDALAAAMGKKR